MTDDTSADHPLAEPAPISRRKRILQSIGAGVVTALAFYYLLGIPGYLLFKDLFR